MLQNIFNKPHIFFKLKLKLEMREIRDFVSDNIGFGTSMNSLWPELCFLVFCFIDSCHCQIVNFAQCACNSVKEL